MEINKEYLTSYYKDLKGEKKYPKVYLYQLFLVGKLSRDAAIITEVSKT